MKKIAIFTIFMAFSTLLLAQQRGLVNTDEVQRANIKLENQRSAREHIDFRINLISDESMISRKIELLQDIYTVTLEFDLTKTHIKNGNEFSESEVSAFLHNKARRIFLNKDELYGYLVLIDVRGVAFVDGAKHQIGSAMISLGS